jgi:predicted Rossmann fold flavoprotein
MMAAGRAAQQGASVLLVEKTYRLGSKLLITGGGRCNITNDADLKGFVAAFGKNGKFLYRAFTEFSNRDLIAFFGASGVEMRTDPDGKVFPSNDSAESVLAVMRKYMEDNKVRLLHNTAVTELVLNSENKPGVTGIKTAGGEILGARNVIVATGGMSYPKTGSSGDGYLLAKQCGHTIVPPRPGLIPLESDEKYIKELQGLALKDTAISVFAGGKKIASENGDVLFTHFGVSGPKVLVLSGPVSSALDEGKVVYLSLNLRPLITAEEFDLNLQYEFDRAGNRTFSNYLKDILPASFAPVFERLCGMDAAKRCNSVNRQERKKVASLLTDFRIRITKTRPIEEATITRGGIALDEIDPQTMESRATRGLYFCGETIDVDGVTGGYNLQEAFSTGYLAGRSAADSLKNG